MLMQQMQTVEMTDKSEHTIDIYLSNTSEAPIYKQIVEQVKQLIAIDRLHPGDRLPAVRQLAQYLGISQGTVVRAYIELKQEGIIHSRRSRGTIVSPADGSAQSRLRQ